ncbi:MAG: helix-turn-helix transcriptional regulator [Trueperaceae bacterium]
MLADNEGASSLGRVDQRRAELAQLPGANTAGSVSDGDAPLPSEVFRRRLREARERRGWSTRELADRLELHGTKMDRATISRIELGAPPKGRNVTIDELFALCFVLNVPPTWLLTPYAAQEPVALTAADVVPASSVRAWLSGRTWLLNRDDFARHQRENGPDFVPPHPTHYWRPEEEEQVYSSSTHPGLWKIRTGAEEIVRTALAGDDENLELELDGLAREIDRQREELQARHRRAEQGDD